MGCERYRDPSRWKDALRVTAKNKQRRRTRTSKNEMRGSLHCALRAPVGMTRYRLRAAVGMTVLRWNPTHRDKTAMNGAPGTRR